MRTQHLRMSVERPQARQDGLAARASPALEHPCDEAADERSRAIAWRSYAGRVRSTTTSCSRSAPNRSESASRLMAHPGATSPSRIRRRQAPCSRVASAETSTSMSDDPAAPATDMVPLDVAAGRDRHVPRGDSGRRDRDDRGAVIAVALAHLVALGRPGSRACRRRSRRGNVRGGRARRWSPGAGPASPSDAGPRRPSARP